MGGPFSPARWALLFRDKDIFIHGFLVTLGVAALALLLAVVLGIILGLFSVSKIKVLSAFSRAYIEFFQNTPLAIQIYFYYFALPFAGIVIPVFFLGVLGVGLYHGAYVAEVVRAGIQSIPAGQMEAAKSQGFVFTQSMRYIIIPQTVKIILPPLTNQAVNLIKNTSVLSVISGGDLMYSANVWSSSGTLSYGPAFVTAGVLYFLICFPLATWARKYEERLKNKETLIISKELSEIN